MDGVLVLDRFEEGKAVCETEDGGQVLLTPEETPADAGEGDVLRPLPNGGWRIDREETNRRRAAALERTNRIRARRSRGWEKETE